MYPKRHLVSTILSPTSKKIRAAVCAERLRAPGLPDVLSWAKDCAAFRNGGNLSKTAEARRTQRFCLGGFSLRASRLCGLFRAAWQLPWADDRRGSLWPEAQSPFDFDGRLWFRGESATNALCCKLCRNLFRSAHPPTRVATKAPTKKEHEPNDVKQTEVAGSCPEPAGRRSGLPPTRRTRREPARCSGTGRANPASLDPRYHREGGN